MDTNDIAALKFTEDEMEPSKTTTSTSVLSQVHQHMTAPGPLDVLLGRGRKHMHHPGNIRLQNLLNMNRPRYNATAARNDKTTIIREIIRIIQTAGYPPGRFLKFHQEIDGWLEVDDEIAHVKVSHAIRHNPKPTQLSEVPAPGIPLEMLRLRPEPDGPLLDLMGAYQLQPLLFGTNNLLVTNDGLLGGLGYQYHASLPPPSTLDDTPSTDSF